MFAMPDNGTSEQYDSTGSYEDTYYDSYYNDSREYDEYVQSYDYTWDWHLSLTQELIINYMVPVLTLVTLIYGVTSWCCLSKFKNYRNYVFLNAILSNLFLNLISRFHYNFEFDGFLILDIFEYVFYYFATAKTHWLLVISHMCYVDLVKVFKGNIRRRHLKSGLFGWGVPLITSAIFCFVKLQLIIPNYNRVFQLPMIINLFLFYGHTFLPVTLNCIIYIIIVFSLCRSFNSSAHTASNIWHRFYVASLIFLLNDILLLYQLLLEVFDFHPVVDFLINVFVTLNPIILDIIFVMLRTNRKIWYEFYINKLNQIHRDHDLNKRRRNVREPADSRAEVLDVSTLAKNYIVTHF